MTLTQAIVGAGVLLAAGLTFVIVWAFSAPERPSLTGANRVGTRLLTVPAGNEAGRGSRRLSLRIWYPTTVNSGKRAPSMDGRVSAAFAKLNGFPALSGDGPPSQSFLDPPALRGKHPVILFSHGGFSFVDQNFSMMQELASHGLVVVSVSHPGESALTVFEDGTTRSVDEELEDAMRILTKMSEEAAADYLVALEGLREARSADERTHAAIVLGERYAEMFSGLKVSLGALLDARQQHLARTVDYLKAASREESHPLFEAMDIEHLGVMGHSMGGHAATRFALSSESEVRAVASLDVPHFLLPGDPRGPLTVPLLSLHAEGTALPGGRVAQTAGANRYLIGDRAAGAMSVQMEVLGASHMNLTDMNYLPRGLRWLGLLGKIDGGRAAEVGDRTVVGFFKEQLLGGSSWTTELEALPELRRVD